MKRGQIGLEQNFVIKQSNMNQDLEQKVRETTEKAMEMFNSDLEIVKFIRQQFEKEYRNSVWHCVVGRKFAVNVTYESGFYIYYYVGAKAFILFKTTQQLFFYYLKQIFEKLKNLNQLNFLIEIRKIIRNAQTIKNMLLNVLKIFIIEDFVQCLKNYSFEFFTNKNLILLVCKLFIKFDIYCQILKKMISLVFLIIILIAYK